MEFVIGPAQFAVIGYLNCCELVRLKTDKILWWIMQRQPPNPPPLPLSGNLWHHFDFTVHDVFLCLSFPLFLDFCGWILNTYCPTLPNSHFSSGLPFVGVEVADWNAGTPHPLPLGSCFLLNSQIAASSRSQSVLHTSCDRFKFNVQR